MKKHSKKPSDAFILGQKARAKADSLARAWAKATKFTSKQASEFLAGYKTPIKLALIAGCLTMTGCSWCQKQAWTPDGVSYTLQRDRHTGEQSDYFGVSWSLKK